MYPSVRLCSQHVHKPLISFLGKRKWPSTPGPQHAHPAAPEQLKASFPDFMKKFKSSSARSSGSAGSGKQAYGEFWEAPEWVWNPRSRQLEEAEIEAISLSAFSTVILNILVS
ncbi:hypothetical protein EW146_g9452 [Bondarzewia mesenterica]|uniref:Uncharacterized protein n=1 Tax=Bondarzewia mesenterica TaxID=1095465 RepID=A0A4S4L823_9AGAM|nr:hypothetical protein EW146_g9452 [Bondarzewia mesenterica]